MLTNQIVARTLRGIAVVVVHVILRACTGAAQ